MFANSKGASLMELVISVGILIIVLSAVAAMSLSSLGGITRSEFSLQASALAQEAFEASRSIKDFDWTALKAGAHGVTDADGYWKLASAPDVIGRYTRTITVTDINAYTKNVAVKVEWDSAGGLKNAVEITGRFTNWKPLSWISRFPADFNGGLQNSVVFVQKDGAEGISLARAGDFKNASVLKTYDFSGSADIKDIHAKGNALYIATANDGSDKEFMMMDLSNISDAEIKIAGSVELSADANKLAVGDKYAYIANNNNSAEVAIVRLADRAKVASINLPSSAGAYGIFLADNVLYVSTAKSPSKEFYAYDVSNPESPSSSPLASVEVDAKVNDIAVQNGYAYLVTDSDSKEIAVVRLSDYKIIGTVNLPSNAAGISIEISNNIAYVGTSGNSGGAEFYVLDAASPDNMRILADLDVGNEKVTDSYTGLKDIFVTTHAGSAEELALIDSRNYAMEDNVDLTGNPEANSVILHGSYLYVGSNDNTNTLQIVKGADSADSQYATSGVFTSPAFDSGSDSASYSTISWSKEGDGVVKFQLRLADTKEGLETTGWIGPDGTSSTYYTISGESIFLLAGAKRWIQYRVFMEGDGLTAPVLGNVSINYGI